MNVAPLFAVVERLALSCCIEYLGSWETTNMEGLGIVCFFGACLLLFVCWTGIIFACWAAELSFAGKPKHFFSLWLGVPALGLVLLICFCYAKSSYESLPSVVFQDISGFAPTADIEFVDSLRHMPTDWDNSYLVLYASDSTINRILANGFAPIQPTDFDEYGCTPTWWKPPTGSSIRVYATNAPALRDKEWRYFASYRLLIYDPESGDSSRRKVYLRYRRP
jgi:hypothetical protein